MNYEDYIYTVAVDAQPILWSVFCEICDDQVTDPTIDDNLVDQQESEHILFHENMNNL